MNVDFTWIGILIALIGMAWRMAAQLSAMQNDIRQLRMEKREERERRFHVERLPPRLPTLGSGVGSDLEDLTGDRELIEEFEELEQEVAERSGLVRESECEHRNVEFTDGNRTCTCRGCGKDIQITEAED
jgi:hypothetical protein